jgi:hypothetical protein
MRVEVRLLALEAAATLFTDAGRDGARASSAVGCFVSSLFAGAFGRATGDGVGCRITSLLPPRALIRNPRLSIAPTMPSVKLGYGMRGALR